MSPPILKVKRIWRKTATFSEARDTRLTTARGWCGDFLARKPGLSAKKALFAGRSEIQTVPGCGDSIQLSGRSGLGVDSSIKASAAHGQSIMSVGFNVINFCKIVRARSSAGSARTASTRAHAAA